MRSLNDGGMVGDETMVAPAFIDVLDSEFFSFARDIGNPSKIRRF